MINEAIISLDIGGTNLRMALVDAQYRLSDVTIVSTEAVAREDFLDRLGAIILDFYREQSASVMIRGVSLGVPAILDQERKTVLQAPNVPGLNGQPIVAYLEDLLGLPVFLEKDVNLLLTYDLMELNIPQQGMAIGIYFGTGIGNSICYDGRILRGKNGVAGELGHIPQLHSDIRCGCDNIGCLEPLGGGRRLVELCETDFIGTHVSDIYACHGDTPQVLEQIDAMAVAVATEINILDPDHVIIGGGLPQMKAFPTERLLERIRFYCRKPKPMDGLSIRFARPNQENGIIGAGIYGWLQLKRCEVSSMHT